MVLMTTDVHHCLGEYHVPVDHPIQKARSFLEQVSHQTSQLGELGYVADRYNIRESSLHVHDNKSYRILEKEIPQTVQAPIAHFLNRMLEQQQELAQR